MCRTWTLTVVSTLVLTAAVPALCQSPGDWPCYHGPQRDNISPSTGLLKVWPEEGPQLLWTAQDIGSGYSSVVVTGERIFTAGRIGKVTHVLALDMAGKLLWCKPNGESWDASSEQSWAVPYAGARATPTVDGDTVYQLSDMGRLAAFDVATGNERWSVDVREVFDAPRPEYGYSESVMVLGDRLFCCAGGKGGYVVALDKRTGETLWTGTKLDDAIGYSSPILAEIDSVQQLICVSGARLLSVAPDTGKTLWQVPFSNKRDNNATDAIAHGGMVFASTGYGGGCVALRPQKEADGTFTVERVWSTELMDNHHGGVVLVDGHLYGSGHEAKGWFCLDAKTGQQRWQAPGKGSLTYADGHLYCLDEKGTMSLMEATPEECRVASSFRIPKGGSGSYWAHPVVIGGRLYVRHADKLFAYQIAP